METMRRYAEEIEEQSKFALDADIIILETQQWYEDVLQEMVVEEEELTPELRKLWQAKVEDLLEEMRRELEYYRKIRRMYTGR